MTQQQKWYMPAFTGPSGRPQGYYRSPSYLGRQHIEARLAAQAAHWSVINARSRDKNRRIALNWWRTANRNHWLGVNKHNRAVQASTFTQLETLLLLERDRHFLGKNPSFVSVTRPFFGKI